MKIGAYISELLLQGHDSVILPGFGEFYTKYSPAKFLPEERKVESPSKTIAFNPDLKSGDTPLIAHLARLEYFDHDQIINYLGTFVDEIKNQLSQGKKVELEKVGVFSELPDGNIHFDPDRSINYLTQAAGYGSVPTPAPVPNISSTSQTDAAHQNESEHMDNNKRPALPPALKWLAFTVVPILLILIILAISFNFFSKDRKPSAADQTLTEEVHTPGAADSSTPDQSPGSQPSDAQTTGQTQAAGQSTPDVTAASQPASQTGMSPTQQPPAAEPGRPVYYIVVGSFPEQAQAEALAQQLRSQGANLASVFMRTGFNYHRVCYGYYYSLAEAEALLPDVQARINKEAYILHR